MSELDRWVDAALRAANEGRWDAAEQAWSRVLAIDPRHPQALFSRGVHAFRAGRLEDAVAAFKSACLVAPHDPNTHLALARVLGEQGNATGEMQAIEASLSADPYFMPGLLAKGECLQRAGRTGAAVGVFRNVLKVIPHEAQWPAGLRPQLLQAQALVKRYGEQLAVHFEQATGLVRSRLDAQEAGRWREAGAILSGLAQPFHSVCNQLQVPRLPAIPFFDRSQFEWVDEVESRTAGILAELESVLADDDAGFKPYVAYPQGVPVNQWGELNHSRRWSGYALWENGTPRSEHLTRCPVTAGVLELAAQPDIPGMCPNAMFSALAPRTHIPPHTGDTNARLVVHLPLIVPDGCRYRVGFEQRNWTVGEVLIFDDSIEHEARNDSDQLRVVLLFDVWNPLLGMQEREMVRALTVASRGFVYQP